uniref:Uncharacterized protein n=1 Tax=Parascaris univalens TaxID=6257 RepID=A0A914ZFZ3_PARUN
RIILHFPSDLRRAVALFARIRRLRLTAACVIALFDIKLHATYSLANSPLCIHRQNSSDFKSSSPLSSFTMIKIHLRMLCSGSYGNCHLVVPQGEITRVHCLY